MSYHIDARFPLAFTVQSEEFYDQDKFNSQVILNI